MSMDRPYRSMNAEREEWYIRLSQADTWLNRPSSLTIREWGRGGGGGEGDQE